jgi:tRNA modification GTPase
MSLNDTIIACATPAGYSSIAVIRVSGKQAISLVTTLFEPLEHVPDLESRRAYYGSIVEPQCNKKIDNVITTCYRAPHSYTGEDVVEISCHGNPLIIDEIMSIAINHGARLAQRGEFTKRALLNGKIDLIQAEAVLDTVYASCDEARALAIAQYEGTLSEKVYELKSIIVDLLTIIEANIDFPEEEDVDYDAMKLRKSIEVLVKEIEELLSGAAIGVKIKEGYRTLIMGRANVGKSTLFNRLVGYDRAIVHELPGTTRDFIEEGIELSGLYLRLIDTAGFFTHAGGVDDIAQQRSNALLEQADLILLLFDGSEPMNEEDVQLYDRAKHKKKILVVNKIDLNVRLSEPYILSDSVKVSAKTGQHLDILKKTIKEVLVPYDERKNILLTRQRHIDALKKIYTYLNNSINAHTIETMAYELHSAREIIGELTGTVMRKDILDRIFDEFCIGK